jgi:hypothetical protein
MLTPPLFKLLVAMLCTASLVSCGGSGNSSTNTGSGSTAPTEVINGIVVPLEPDPVANKATLAGIDTNNNGVRDDVERKIANADYLKTGYSGSINRAKAYQQITSKSLTDAEIIAIKKILECGSENAQTIDGINLPDLYSDTNERRHLYYEYLFKKRTINKKDDFESIDKCVQ